MTTARLAIFLLGSLVAGQAFAEQRTPLQFQHVNRSTLAPIPEEQRPHVKMPTLSEEQKQKILNGHGQAASPTRSVKMVPPVAAAAPPLPPAPQQEQPAQPDPNAKITITYGELVRMIQGAQTQTAAQCSAAQLKAQFEEITRQATHKAP